MADLPDEWPAWMQIADPDNLRENPLHLVGDLYFPRTLRLIMLRRMIPKRIPRRMILMIQRRTKILTMTAYFRMPKRSSTTVLLRTRMIMMRRNLPLLLH